MPIRRTPAFVQPGTSQPASATLPRIGNSVFGYFLRLGVELTQVIGRIRGEPDVAVLIGGFAVRSGFRSLQNPFLKFLRLGIEAPQLVAKLTQVIHVACRDNKRIASAPALCGYLPLLDGGLYRTGNDDPFRSRWTRETGRQVVDDNRNLVLLDRSAISQHPVQGPFPVFAGHLPIGGLIEPVA